MEQINLNPGAFDDEAIAAVRVVHVDEYIIQFEEG